MARDTKKQKSPSAWLAKELDKRSTALGRKLASIRWDDRETYLFWAAQHYYLVKHTMDYIRLAAQLADPVSRDFWNHALRGEHNHHKLLERDTKSIGGSVTDFPVLEATKALVDYVYAEMRKTSGRALFGYALLLEGMSCSVGTEIFRKIVAGHGKGAASFLQVHSDSDDGDDGHYVGGKAFVEENYNEAAKKEIFETLKRSERLYGDILIGLTEAGAAESRRKCG